MHIIKAIKKHASAKNCDFPKDTLIVGITREGELFIPNGETTLLEGDIVIFMGLSHSLNILAGKFFHEKEFVKYVTIIGGGNVGLKLAKTLENPMEAGQLSEDFGLGLAAAIVAKSVPKANYVYLPAGKADAKKQIEELLNIFLAYDQTSIGGKLPDKGFYWK